MSEIAQLTYNSYVADPAAMLTVVVQKLMR